MIWIAAFALGFLLLFLVGRVLFPKDRSNAARLMNTYRVMTRELLDNTPDDQLIKAVIANLLAKAEDAKGNAYAVIPALSQARCAVYSVWLFQNELMGDDPTVLRKSGQFGFSELAADGLELLGFDALAADLRNYLQTADDALAVSMKEALATLPIDSTLIGFIRDRADEFCDGDNG